MSETAAELTAQLERDKAAFNLTRRKIAGVLANAMPKPGAEEIFIAQAVETGVEHTIDKSKRDPAYFDLGDAPDHSVQAKLAAPLTEAYDLCHKMDGLVAKRDSILRKADPDRHPTYIWMGREFSIDPKMETMTYLDTGTTHAFVHEEVRPRPEPSPSRDRSR